MLRWSLMHSHPTLSRNAQNSPFQIQHVIFDFNTSTKQHVHDLPMTGDASFLQQATITRKGHSLVSGDHGGSLRIVRGRAELHGETAIIFLVKAADLAWQVESCCRVGVWCSKTKRRVIRLFLGHLNVNRQIYSDILVVNHFFNVNFT